MSGPTAIASPPRLLGVFAHPDDEVFCAGGTLAKYAAAGAEIMVVSATRGQAGQIRDARVATRRTLGQVREQELAQSCARLGVQHAVCLDYGDGTLQSLDREQLIRDVVEIIRSFRPDVVICFGPDGGYGHPDHVTMSLVTTEACQRAGSAAHLTDQIEAGLAPHQPARLYHSFFPRSRMLLMERLVRWLVTKDHGFHGSLDFIQALLLLSEETTMLGYASDSVDLNWYPAGFYIIEQGEPATNLYLILSGQAEVVREDRDGTLHVLARLGPGRFFGEEGIAHRQARNAHIVAVESVTCLVFAPSEPTLFAGRGEDALLVATLPDTAEAPAAGGGATTCIDVSGYIRQKMAAMSAHHSQFPLEPDMLPEDVLLELFGREYFIRVYPAQELETDLLPARQPAAPRP